MVAGTAAGGHADCVSAQKAMTGLKKKVYQPNPKANAVYRELYALYKQLHDSFGTQQGPACGDVMKKLLDIRGAARNVKA